LAPSLFARDLSSYREFQLDNNLPAVAKQAGMEPAEAKVIHQRPGTEIQELSWRAEPADSVKGIVFSFYNGELFRMVVDYDRYNTEGLTAQDMIEAISATYGAAADPSAAITVPSAYGGDETAKVIARWEGSDWSFNLIRFKYEPSFALVAFSKRLDTEARAAVDEAVRLDRQEAPQREIARQNKEDEEKRLKQEKARLANRPDFRP
jgi:hypothetical protein